MADTDLQGFLYAKIRDTKIGDKVKTDGDFTCLRNGAIRTVRGDGKGLFIICAEKRHYLDGQKQGDHYLGLYPVLKKS